MRTKNPTSWNRLLQPYNLAWLLLGMLYLGSIAFAVYYAADSFLHCEEHCLTYDFKIYYRPLNIAIKAANNFLGIWMFASVPVFLAVNFLLSRRAGKRINHYLFLVAALIGPLFYLLCWSIYYKNYPIKPWCYWVGIIYIIVGLVLAVDGLRKNELSKFTALVFTMIATIYMVAEFLILMNYFIQPIYHGYGC